MPLVPPLVSISQNTGSGTNESPFTFPAHAWRIRFLAAVSLKSLSLPFAANACAVAMWKAMKFWWLALLMAIWASECAFSRAVKIPMSVSWRPCLDGGLLLPPLPPPLSLSGDNNADASCILWQ
jgi:hypothetical protein